MPEGRQAQVHRRQGQGRQAGEGREGCQTAYTQAVNGIEAQISALDQNDPNYEAQRAQLEAQETAAGTTQQSCIKKAQSS